MGLQSVIGGLTKENLKAAGGVAAVGVLAGILYNIPKNRINVNNNDLSFPLDFPNGKDPFMSLQFNQYQRPNVRSTPFLSIAGAIRLPIPNNLIDNQSVTYNTEPMGAAAGSAFNELSKGSTGSIADTAQGVILGAAQGIYKTATNSATQLSGTAINPFLTVFFESPAFKEHTFTWKLTPRNDQESTRLKDIIKKFKASMLPSLAGSRIPGGQLFSYPDVVEIKLNPSSEVS
jgi:hypothetical protein